MNVFDIIGPVMIGPSSSHTAGAVRIGSVVRKLLGEEPVSCIITLHGSFAETYRGHGTDKAIIGGLLGMNVDDANIRHSFELAQKSGMAYQFKTANLGEVHPNTALIEAKGASNNCVTVMGYSVGGGNILIKQINGVSVEFTGQYFTMVIAHADVPGIVASVTGRLADESINIAYMKLYRNNRGGEAYMVIEADQPVSTEVVKEIKLLKFVKSVTVIQQR